MRDLLIYNSLFVGQLYKDKSLVLHARNLIFSTTDLQTVNYITQQITARADLFLKYNMSLVVIKPVFGVSDQV